MTIEETRKILRDKNNKYSDEQIRELISSAETLADLAIDAWIALSPEEKKKWRQKK